MKTRIFISLLMLCVVTGVMAQDASYTLNVQDFTELTVVDGVKVTYIQREDSSGYVHFRCAPELASQLTFTNLRNRLTIQTTADETPIAGIPEIFAYSAFIRHIENDGDSLVTVNTNSHLGHLKLSQIGNGSIKALNIDAEKIEAGVNTGCGTIDVAGKSKAAKLRNVGTGKLDAAGLSTDVATVFLFGPGPVECNVSDKLTVYGMGLGRVFLTQKPAKIVNRTIGVKIFDADEAAAEQAD